MCKVVSHLSDITACLPVHAHSDVILKDTVVAGEDDGVYRLEDLVCGVTSLSVQLGLILASDRLWVVIQHRQIALTNRKVGRNCTHWGLVEVPSKCETQRWIFLGKLEVLLEHWFWWRKNDFLLPLILLLLLRKGLVAGAIAILVDSVLLAYFIFNVSSSLLTLLILQLFRLFLWLILIVIAINNVVQIGGLEVLPNLLNVQGIKPAEEAAAMEVRPHVLHW